ncbi:MAG: RNB domain-containing ribonuclease [Planctomycetota bacterium]
MDFVAVWYERKGGLELGAIKRAGPTKVQLIDARGKAQRIPRGRLLDELGAPVAAANPEAASRALEARLAGWRAQRAQLDEQALFERLEAGREYALADLAEAELGARDDDAISRLALGLLNAQGRLLDCVRVHQGALVRQDEALYAQLRARRVEQAERARRIAALEGWWASGEADAGEVQPLLDELVDYALRDPADVAKEVKALAKALDCASPDALLERLEARGVLPRHTNEVPERHGLVAGFEPAALAELADPEPGRGLDLRPRLTVAIDPPGTHEADDALSWWEEDGERWVAIHIARPAWPQGGALDRAARARASTAYFDDRAIPLLPAALVARYSLAQGEDRPALSYVARVQGGGLVDGRFTASTIRVDHAWTYAEADERPELGDLIALSEGLRQARFERGARSLERARVRFGLDAEGRVVRSVDPRTSPASRVVGECMIHYNTEAARAIAEAGVRAPFRAQPAAEGPSPVQVTSEPAPHHGLGAPAYVQATSPLRRYADWIAQQQLLAALGQGSALPPVAIVELCEELPKRERKVRQAEDERQRYLQCAWLAAHPAPLHGWLVSKSPARWRVHVDELGREQTVRPPRFDAAPGATLELEAQDVEPRARSYGLRVVGLRSGG